MIVNIEYLQHRCYAVAFQGKRRLVILLLLETQCGTKTMPPHHCQRETLCVSNRIMGILVKLRNGVWLQWCLNNERRSNVCNREVTSLK